MKNHGKVILSLLLSFALLFSCVTPYATAVAELDSAVEIDPIDPSTVPVVILSGECGEEATFTLTDKGTLTISGSGAMDDYEAADETPWAEVRDSVKKVVINDGITSIGGESFAFLNNLTTVTIADSVTKMEHLAFYNCGKLTDVQLGNGLQNIGIRAFELCTSLQEITITQSVTKIEDSAFYMCNSLTDVTLPDNLQEIGSIAFRDCTVLEEISLPDSITFIGVQAFYNTPYYKNAAYWTDDILYIDNHLIVSSINVESCTVQEGTKTLAAYSFHGNSKLKSITIPVSVTNINALAFYDTTALTDVYYAGSQAQWNEINIGTSNDSLLNANIHFAIHDHEWNDGIVTTPATCTANGIKEFTCTLCEETKTEAIAAVGHTAGAAATCTQNQVCTVCGDILTDKLGHNYTAVITDPTCTQGGYTTHTCTVCGDNYQADATPAAGHTPGAAATCTQDQVCTVCGDILTDKLGHNYAAVITDPTCTQDGYTTHTCTVCGDNYQTDATPAAGHDFDDGTITTAPTPFATGIKTFTCTVCGDTKNETIAKITWSQADQYAFSNSYSHFTTGSYTMLDSDFEKLSNYILACYGEEEAMPIINSLQEERMSKWGGSCYGMSSSSLLDFYGKISMTDNFDPDADTLHDVDSPRINAQVQSAINYYHISQLIPFLWNDAGSYYHSYNSNWKEGLISLTEEAEKGLPFLFSYWWIESYISDGKIVEEVYGHAIVVKGYDGTDDNGNHRIIAYDCRYPNRDLIILVDKSYSSCIVDGCENAYAIEFIVDFSWFDLIDIDGADNQIAKANTEAKSDTTSVSVMLNGNMTIWNNSDEYIKIENGIVTNTMDIAATHMVVYSTADGNPGKVKLVFDVDNAENFTFDCEAEELDAQIRSKTMFASVQAENASAATISETQGISVSGKDAAYTIHQSVNEEDCDMFSFKGVSSGVTSVRYEDGTVFISGNKTGEVSVGRFTGSSYEEMQFVSDKEEVKLQVSQAAQEYTLGDIDENGQITSADARAALRAAVGLDVLTEKQTKAADADKNGTITSNDARAILRCAVGLEDL